MEGLQPRPVVAFVGLAALAAMMVLGGLQAEPSRVVAAPAPVEFSREQRSDVLVGAVLSPRPPASVTDAGAAPELVVPAVAQSALSTPVPIPRAAQQSGPAPRPRQTAAAQPAPGRPSAGKPARGKGHGKAARADSRTPAAGPAKPGKGRGR